MNKGLLLTQEEQMVIIKHLVSFEKAVVVDIAQLFPEERKITVKRTLAWMAKTSIIRISGFKRTW